MSLRQTPRLWRRFLWNKTLLAVLCTLASALTSVNAVDYTSFAMFDLLLCCFAASLVSAEDCPEPPYGETNVDHVYNFI